MRNGKSIRIREDIWIPKRPIGGPAIRDEPRTIAELINQETHEWEEQILQDLFEEEVVQLILQIPISEHSEEDKLIWASAKSGNYTIKEDTTSLETQPVSK